MYPDKVSYTWWSNRFHNAEIAETIEKFKKSQRELIMLVNQKLKGWANYHRYGDAEEAFKKVDVAVQTALLDAAKKKHPKLNTKGCVFLCRGGVADYIPSILPTEIRKSLYEFRTFEISLCCSSCKLHINLSCVCKNC